VSYCDSQTDDGLSTVVTRILEQAANRIVVFLFQQRFQSAFGQQKSVSFKVDPDSQINKL